MSDICSFTYLRIDKSGHYLICLLPLTDTTLTGLSLLQDKQTLETGEKIVYSCALAIRVDCVPKVQLCPILSLSYSLRPENNKKLQY